MGGDPIFGVVAGNGPRTLADRAFTQIHEAIITGRLAPGERLPIEDLASRLDMSPMPIREALRQLHAVGLVQNVPHRGAAVTELAVEELRSIYEARLALEPTAIRYAAERRSDEDVERINAAWATLEALQRKELEKGWRAHREFHFALYTAADSPWLSRLINPLWEGSERYRLATPVKWTLDRRAHEHEAMVDAVVDRDGERAATILHDHLATTANELAALMDDSELFELLDPPAGIAAPAD